MPSGKARRHAKSESKLRAMPMYQRLGDVPRKRHIQFRDNGTLLNEEVMGLEGFSGNESILYHLQTPVRIRELGAFEPISPSATTLLIKNSRLMRSSHFRGAGEALSCPLTGGWPGNEGKAGARYGSSGHAIDDDRFSDSACFCVLEQDAGAFGGEVLVPPREQREQHRTEIAAPLRQNVFVPRRLLTVTLPLQKAGFNQRIEAARQHVRRNFQALLEFVEAFQAVNGVPKDEDAPPLTDPLQAAGDGTLHVAEVLALHGP